MSRKVIYILTIFAMVLGMIGFQPVQPVYAASNLRISQISGVGGLDNSPYKEKFIELFNAGSTDASLAGLSLQYAAASSLDFGDPLTSLIELPSDIIPAGGYYLIKVKETQKGQASIPEPDFDVSTSSPFEIDVSSGKVALVTETTALGCSSSTNPCSDGQLARVIDRMGYGGVNFYEGDASGPSGALGLSVQRKDAGCQDTDQSNEDLIAATPLPRNSASETYSCTPTQDPVLLKLSQVYGGGGNSGAPYKHDFIEIFNAGTAAVSLDGLSLQYASATGAGNFGASATQLTELPNVSLEPGQYFLVQEAAGNGDVPSLPDPDYIDPTPIAMGASAGKVALVTGTTSLGCNGGSNPCDATQLARIIDLLGFGNANFYEGAAAAPTLGNALSAQRKSGGCQDTDENGDDFEALTPAPRNTSSPINLCGPAPTGPTVDSIVPANGASAPKDTNITITFSEEVTVSAGWYDITCSVSGNHTAAVTDANPVYTLNPDVDFDTGETCTVTIDKDLVVNATNQNMAADFVSTFNVVAGCGDPFTAIYDIQGSGDASPIAGQTVTTEGVVTANFQVGGKNGYFIQDPLGDGDPTTSDGIFVYSTNPTVNVGDALRITGKVSEYYNLTQITPTNSTTVMVCGTGQTIEPVVLTLPTTAPRSYEAYEGMLVTFPQDLYISEYYNYDRYGEIVLASSRHFSPTHSNEPGADAIAAEAAYQLDMIKVDDTLGTQNPPYLRHPDGTQFTKEHYFRGGDTVTGLTGVMDYNFGEYKIQPVGTATYESLNPRPAAPSLVEGEIRIASLNVLNYFVTIDTGSNICGPAGNMNCRGADTAEELTRQRTKIIAAILGMEADVIGLIEIENEHPNIAADAAVIDLVEGLNAATAPGTYAYVATGNIGTDAIKQAFIYKPAKVDQIGSFAILDETVDPAYDTTRNRPSLAASFKDKITNEIFTVSVNHFKSKGSACVGDPDMGDGQGNCNLTRTAAAEVLVDWLETDPTDAGSGMYVIIGDLNAYAKEDPIDAIKLGADGIADTADDCINLVERFRGDNAYGYVFDGRTGYLDHALANKKFASYVLDANFWNINADESDVFDYDMTFKPVAQQELYSPDAYRSSDHDPVLISLILNHPPTAVDDEYTTNQGVALEVDAPGVLANDTDPNIYDKITASLVENSGPANGTLVFNEDGSFVYTPDPAFSGIDTFEYTMHATPGLMAEYSDTATVTINVTHTNTAPDLYPIEDQTVTALTTLTFTAEATDPESPEQTLTFSLVGAPEGATIDPVTGIFSWTPTAEQGNQVYNFTVKVCDDGTPVLCDEKPVKVTVLAANIAPKLYPITDKTVDELVELTVAAEASDPDLPDQTLTFSLVNAPDGAVIDAATGLFTWTPTEAQGPGVFTITVKVCDDGEPVLCDETTFNVTVNEVNLAPSIEPALEDMTINEMELTSFTVVAVDPDLPANTLTYSLVGAPVGAVIDATMGEFTWTPTELQGPGVYTFTVKVCDDGDPVLCDEQELTITVLEVNLPPEFLYPIEDKTIDELTEVTYILKATDPDKPAQNISYSMENAPEGATLNPVTATFSWTPTEAQGPGVYTITFRACDDGEPVECAEAEVTITVLEVNLPPVIDPIPDQEVDELELLTFTAQASDPDIPVQTLAFSLKNAPEGAAIDPVTGVFTWTPNVNQGTQTYLFQVCVSDGAFGVCTNVTVLVNNVDFPPVAVDDAYTTDEDVVLNVPAPGVLENDTDPDSPVITAVLVENVSHGELVLNADGSFVYTPNQDYNGTDTFTYKASDGALESEVATVTITINPVNDAPVAVDDEYTVAEDNVLTVAAPGVLENDYDVDGDVLSAALRSNVSHGVLVLLSDGSFTYTPDPNFFGTDSFTYTLLSYPQPDSGWTDWATVTITVTPVNDAPVLDEIPDFTIPELEPFAFIATASDVDDTELTFSLVNPPEGAAIDPETGEFTWTPTHEQVGEHEITLCVSDGELEDCQTFTITVIAVNASPVAVEDEYTLNQDEILNVAAPGVLENDSDPDDDPLTAVLVTTTQHGTLILSADGSFMYVPNAGYYGEDSFTYKAFDGEYYSEVVTVTLTIVKKPVWNLYFPIIKK
ncbi:MAG: ExeM/NucH family extracellular endonuclease [Chloroflexi bacterium]|nr:ExeM/NucH family extracellular endonuclease [Chloroflexota bacterium]